jgi:hypothetical protein
VTGDPTMPAGSGETDWYGNIKYSTAGTQTEQDLALAHEQLHSFLRPKMSFLRDFRASLAANAYWKSQTLRYLEEALAETYSQFKVNGISIESLLNGLRFPLNGGYNLTIGGIAGEVVLGTVVVGGVTYTVYLSSK